MRVCLYCSVRLLTWIDIYLGFRDRICNFIPNLNALSFMAR